jgi:hypothetical protein
MKITKTRLKKIIQEELNELTDAEFDAIPGPSAADQGVGIARKHLGQIVAELVEGGLDPHIDRSAHTAFTPDLDTLAFDVYRRIMTEMGAA